jgi:hypothetical protein
VTTNETGRGLSDWLAGGFPGVEAGRVSLRKMRLAACGCCRAVWTQLAPVCRHAVRLAEWYADGAATARQLEAAWRACRRAEWGADRWSDRYLLTEEVHRVAAPIVALADVRVVASDLRPWRGDSVENDEVEALCFAVLRDVLGGPAHPPGSLAAWRTTDVVSLARVAYGRRDFALLPRLADALEAAGCQDPELLNHCRAGAPHAAGCWVLDLLR